MDSTQRISERGRPVYLTSKQPKVNQTTEAIVSVSEDRSVSGEQRDKVGGVSADRKANLNRYKELLEGKSLSAMTQLMSAEKTDDESVARKALEKPSLNQEPTLSSGSEDKKVGQVDSEQNGTDSKKSESAKEGTQKTKEKSASGEELTQEEADEVQKLKERDREVRTHEQAHVAAGGQYVRGGIKYEYQRGPDGRNYAVGGHVNIDVSEAETPEATITKMQQVKRAALAPAEPSGADRSVAAAAAQKEQQARTEILENRQKEVAERRKEVNKTGKEVRETSESASQNTDSTQGATSVDSVASDSSSPSPASEASPSEVPQADTPKVRNHMNLAREARMRIKRGEYWQA
jgi:hypothetical protein